MVPGFYDPRQAQIGTEGLTRPNPEERAAQIAAWAICWPWHLVWTFCVYNPLRYVGEFLLQELQSALFEISEKQFSSIEQDLKLDSSLPHPAHERQSSGNVGFAPAPAAVRSNASGAIGNQIGNRTGFAASPAEGQNREPLQATVAESTQEDSLDSNAERQAVRQSETSNNVLADAVNAASKNTAQASVNDESSNAHAWTPPEPTPFVAMSNRPLRGTRVSGSSRQSGQGTSTVSPPKPPTES